ncbi:MAG: hypothetical protein LBE76_09200 [Nitrososphaerota archaeon]|jgi:hypothetical protein|nr:hypothetical protein [Nitrososphaerota archaeon]
MGIAKMGQIVFNTKICDHSDWCPAKKACERLMGVGANQAAIYTDTISKKITVNGAMCASYNGRVIKYFNVW